MLWPDPAPRYRIAAIRDNLIARISETEREGWLGEIGELKISLARATDKLAQTDRHGSRHPVDLGMPSSSAVRWPSRKTRSASSRRSASIRAVPRKKWGSNP